MKFAHMADLHLGGWRDPELERINLLVFERAIDTCISENVDFVLMSGDLFDTAMPPFDILEIISKKLSELRRRGIPVYTISGSHDFSPSGKTMLRVLENAELIVNVAKGSEFEGKLKLEFVTDKKTGVKITGIFGKKGSLDEGFYRNLDRSIENEPGYKIFLFHAGIEEYRPDHLKDVAAMPLSLLPKGFDYYAGGHIHHRSEQVYDRGRVVFPGPLFPCNFQELEKLLFGGFYLVTENAARFIELKERETISLAVNADGRAAKEVEGDIEQKIESLPLKGCILLIRVFGTLSEGKPTNINFRRLFELAEGRGAVAVRRSTSALLSRDYEEIKVSTDSIENIENRLITEHSGKSGIKDERALINRLIKALDIEKNDGETTAVFEKRLITDAEAIIFE